MVSRMDMESASRHYSSFICKKREYWAYPRVLELVPLGGEVVADPFSSPGQGHPSYQQDDQHEVRRQRGDPHCLYEQNI